MSLEDGPPIIYGGIVRTDRNKKTAMAFHNIELDLLESRLLVDFNFIISFIKDFFRHVNNDNNVAYL